MSLYAKLGFDIREPFAVVQGNPLALKAAGGEHDESDDDRLSGAAWRVPRVGVVLTARRVDEVVDQVDNLAGPFDVRKMADAGEHLEPASWTGFVQGVAVLDGDDPVLVAPDDQHRQVGRQVQPIERTHRLSAVVDHRAQRPQERLARLRIGQRRVRAPHFRAAR